MIFARSVVHGEETEESRERTLRILVEEGDRAGLRPEDTHQRFKALEHGQAKRREHVHEEIASMRERCTT